MVDTVLFDLDNTLLDFNKAEKIAVERTLREMGVTPDERMLKRYSELNLAQWHLLEQGKITRSQVKVQRYVNLFREYHIEGDPAEAAKVYEAYLAIGHYYVEGAEELLKHLSEKYRLYMVTNGTLSVQKGRIKSAGMRPYFKDIFIQKKSVTINRVKPILTIAFQEYRTFTERTPLLLVTALPQTYRAAKTPAFGPSGIILIRARILQKFSQIMRLMSFQRLKTYWKKFSLALMFYGIENKI